MQIAYRVRTPNLQMVFQTIETKVIFSPISLKSADDDSGLVVVEWEFEEAADSATARTELEALLKEKMGDTFELVFKPDGSAEWLTAFEFVDYLKARNSVLESENQGLKRETVELRDHLIQLNAIR